MPILLKKPMPIPSGRMRQYFSIKVLTTPAAKAPFLGEISIEAACRAAACLTRAAYESQGWTENVLSYDLARFGAQDRCLSLCDPDETFIDSNLGSAIVEMLDEIQRDWTPNI
jgi:hypothetical protein